MKSLTIIAPVLLGVHCVAASNCNTAVSLVDQMNNDQCQALCAVSANPEKDPAFTRSCALAHYQTKNGRAVPTHSCMTNIVYGYTDSTTLSTDGKITTANGSSKYPTTPAECQLACQQDDDCHRFSFNVDTKKCLLKTREAVKSALDPSSDYCPVTVQTACKNELYSCLTCNETVACAWHSAKDLSGWKYCASSEDPCVSPQFAVCKRQAAIVANVTNAECQSECNKLLGAGATAKELATNEKYSAKCAEHHYWIDAAAGKAIPSGDCYNNVVYGLMQDDTRSTMIAGLITTTPALCQAECQAVDGCVSYSWVSDVASRMSNAVLGQCLLKSQEMLNKAVALDPSYCNIGSSTYGFMNCNGTEACAWSSSYHVSGPRTCADVKEFCKMAA